MVERRQACVGHEGSPWSPVNDHSPLDRPIFGRLFQPWLAATGLARALASRRHFLTIAVRAFVKSSVSMRISTTHTGSTLFGISAEIITTKAGLISILALSTSARYPPISTSSQARAPSPSLDAYCLPVMMILNARSVKKGPERGLNLNANNCSTRFGMFSSQFASRIL